jgi:hypothetical protein
MPRAKAWCTAELEVEDQRLIPWGSRSCGVEWRERRGRRARMRALVVAAVAVARLGGWDLPPDARVKPEWGSSPSRDPVLFFFFDLCLDPDSGWISTRAHVNPR